MKKKYSKFACGLSAAALALALGACNDYLDIEPPSDISPDVYLYSADQLAAYANSYYTGSSNGDRGSNAFPHHGIGGSSYSSYFFGDEGTDNETGTNDRFFDGASKVKVGASGGDWNFEYITRMNYFLETVLPRYEAGQVSGSEEAIRHYIGEIYMLRAIEYFKKLCALGDFPIITQTFGLDKPALVEASKRAPRNMVARFILEDMDRAIELLSDGTQTGGRNRITKDAARLFKARVALYEGTFEKYFAGTPFVPDKTAGWPGASKDYNKDFVYDNTTEVNFFLDQALKESKLVADAHPTLTVNNKKMVGLTKDGFAANPYHDMFSTQDLTKTDEALMYRTYIDDISGGHCLNQYITGKGFTQEFANAFLMDNGLPIYAANSGYAGDDFVADTKVNRDWRWRLFMKAPGEYVYEDNTDMRVGCGKKNRDDAELKAPAVVASGTGAYFTCSTGYHKGKGWSTMSAYSKGGHDVSAAIVFRAAEAYLIYMEACCERKGDGLDADAWKYWSALRTRAGLPADANITINATDFDQEQALTQDLGLYSAGSRLTSKVLYNIRRERRCELMGEGMRWDDLIRWRALDQLKSKPMYKHGCKIFGPMLDWCTQYAAGTNKGKPRYLKYDQEDSSTNNVSSPSDTEGGLNGDARYLSLLRVSDKNDWYHSGYSWRMAHYLSPIAEDHFVQTATGDLSTSVIYQNPYWSMVHDTAAEQ